MYFPCRVSYSPLRAAGQNVTWSGANYPGPRFANPRGIHYGKDMIDIGAYNWSTVILTSIVGLDTIL
jgi:hypothetical protein